MTSLKIKSLSVKYGRHEAVRDFEENVRPGEWLCLIGPNGAGKSSVLRAIVGLAPHTGSVTIDDTPVKSRSVRRRAQLVAYVPQVPLLPDSMTVHEYVLLGRNPYVLGFSNESREDFMMVEEVLRRLDLVGYSRRELSSLSGGERQRVVIARALAQEAPLLLLDEPTSALDIGHQQQALELVDRMRREHGLTVVSAMHDLTLAGLYSDRLSLMHQGVVVASGPAESVLKADTLAEFYGVSANVHTDGDGTVVVIPKRSDTAKGG